MYTFGVNKIRFLTNMSFLYVFIKHSMSNVLVQVETLNEPLT